MTTRLESQPLANSSGSAPYRILAMELEINGHHPGYIQNLARYWKTRNLPGELIFLVTPKFMQRHIDVVEEIGGYRDYGVRIISFTEAEYHHLEAVRPWRYFRGWSLFCKYLRALQADHGVVMYFDFLQVPSLLGPKPPCPFSAIYFRPTFHYPSFSNYVSTLSGRIKAWRKEWLLRRVLRNKQLKILFSVDPLAVDYINAHLRPAGRAARFPDPVRVYHDELDIKALRNGLGIEPGRRVFLLLGGLDRRKGVSQLLNAAALLPAEAARRVCLLLVGPVEAVLRDEVYRQIESLRQNKTVQILLKDEFVVDREVQTFYRLSDVVLTTYQRHVGMSSALVRAAAAGKPVLSAKDGLLGELVHRLRLGGTVDSTDPQRIAAALAQWSDINVSNVYDGATASEFARENEAEETGRVFFSELGKTFEGR